MHVINAVLVVSLILVSGVAMAMDRFNGSAVPNKRVSDEIKVFYNAINTENIPLVESGIASFDFIDNPPEGFDAPLLYATRIGSTAIVKLFLERYYHADKYQNLRNQGYLLSASTTEAMIKLYLDVNIDLNYCEGGLNALYISMEHGKVDIAKELLTRRVNINKVTNTGETLLFAAALSGSPYLTEYLIEAGINIGHKNKEGKTALDYGVYRWGKRSKVVNLLKVKQ